VAHDLSGSFLAFWGFGMRWTEARQGVRMIKFLSILSRYDAKGEAIEETKKHEKQAA
jgi:hypothetical protein